MNRIKKYFKSWDFVRIIRAVIAISLLLSYYFQGESLFLFIGIMLAIQVVFNIGCPGGSCATNIDKTTKPVIEIRNYEPKNK